ncbi:hypothetical protein [Prauserella sp. PE36]|uniref:hypothetical protein n=1 Tax=Prauserella sp. PE36 TaxID=1504709 RepID=UPI001F2B928A|nr:hypothetical protein [Prauserella sp. PE36]
MEVDSQMASHEETLAHLQQSADNCLNIHGAIQNAVQLSSDLLGSLQASLGNFTAYTEVAGYCQSVLSQLEASAQAMEQTKHAIDGLMARFHGA